MMRRENRRRKRRQPKQSSNSRASLPYAYRCIVGFFILWAVFTIAFIHIWAPHPQSSSSVTRTRDEKKEALTNINKGLHHHRFRPEKNKGRVLGGRTSHAKKKELQQRARTGVKGRVLGRPPNVTEGGKKKIVIVIPSRQEEHNYERIMQHLEAVHESRKHDWDMFVFTVTEEIDIDARDKEPHFRRAWLLNAGIDQVIKQGFPPNETCLATFSTETLPLVSADYGWCDEPTLLCSELSCYYNSLPYPEYSAGVIIAQLEDWITVNGYTDSAYDSDGEDEELYLRFKLSKLLQEQNGTEVFRRPPAGQGKCECLAPEPSVRRVRPMAEQARITDHLVRLSVRHSDEWRSEGLSTVSYQVVTEDHQVPNNGFSTTLLGISEPEPVIDNVLVPKMVVSNDRRQEIVLVIPYRDRRVHYEKMMRHIQKLRKKVFRIWNVHVFVIEQMNNDLFRKGWLSNVGFHEAAKRFPHKFTCVVQHDVDLFPNLDTVSYGWCDQPTQVCTEIPCFGNFIPYQSFTGGVLSLRLDHWIKANGYTNRIWGWGGEDDNLRYRLLANDLMQEDRALRRPPLGEGYCDCLNDKDHDKRDKDAAQYEAVQEELDILIRNPDNFTGFVNDGYSTTNYSIVNNFIDEYGSLWFQVNYTSEKDWSSWFFEHEISKKLLKPNDLIYQKGRWDGSPVVLKDYRLMFFTTPKVGCTVFKQLFRRMMGYKDWRSSKQQTTHNPETNGLTYLYDYPIDQANAMMIDPNFTKAIFVRDPKTRFLSAYLDKAVSNGGHHIVHTCCQNKLSSSPLCVNNTFAESLGKFLSLTFRCWDPHWEPQSARIPKKFWNYINFVGHLENAANDTQRLLEDLGIWNEFGKSGWGKYGNESIFASAATVDHATGAADRLKMYYTSWDLEKTIEGAYAADYSNPVLNLTNHMIYENPFKKRIGKEG